MLSVPHLHGLACKGQVFFTGVQMQCGWSGNHAQASILRQREAALLTEGTPITCRADTVFLNQSSIIFFS